ncbi:MAG: HDIG domain-containing protein [Chloroflexaceae bacterium]|nr:HDIG domain-containing protein [Chloroflexaceae bacterium]
MVQRWLAHLKSVIFQRLPFAQGKKVSSNMIILMAGALLAVGLLLSLMLRLPNQTGDITVGEPSSVTIISPVTVEFESELLTNQKKAQVEASPELIVYAIDYSIPSEQRAELRDLLLSITRVLDDPTYSPDEQRQRLLDLSSASVLITDTLATTILDLEDAQWQTVSGRTLDAYDRSISEYDSAIDETSINLLRERLIPYWTGGLPDPEEDLVRFFVTSFLKINRTVDEQRTREQRAAAVENTPPVKVEVKEGETIVRKGDIVRPEVIEKLEATGALPRQLNIPDINGLVLLASLLAATFMVYLIFFQRPITLQARPLFTIIMTLIMTAVAARLLQPVWSEYPYAFPLATIVLVFTIIFNGHLAIASALLLSLVIGLQGDNSLELTMTMLIGSITAIFSVRGAERSLTFLLAGIGVAAATVLTQTAFWLTTTTTVAGEELLNILLFSSMNGSLSAILALGLFNLVEWGSGVVTPLQLMQLAHPSQPLLRKLMREAPGTHFHSVSVGNLAESAAEAIGADALLLRVAAYYHDIGKTLRPLFFTENQLGTENVHNDLDPQISAEIIIDHVTEGIKMARASALPQPIIDFIATHHGTQVIQHFYQQALRNQDSVNVNHFRYPGPKPFSREQGIMMLADSVEATVRSKAQHGKLVARRSVSNGTASNGVQTIDELVASIIDSRVQSGQLDNTDLTLKDLKLIHQAFVTCLQGIYHPRVDYPQPVSKA